MAGRILVLQHQPEVDADALAHHLAAAGVTLVVVSPERQAVPPLDGFDALVVLGGDMHVWEEDRHPWLVGEKAAIRTWIAGPTRPLLGICLGHQLIADALGGEVARRDTPEVGVRELRLTASGVGDPLVGPLGATFLSLQWHEAEVRRLPADAVVLATDGRSAVQAMRVGTAAWGVQFHPEVGSARAAEWGAHPDFRAELDAGDGPGTADRFPAELDAAAAALARTTAALAGALVAQLAAGPQVAPPGVRRLAG